MPKCLTIHSDQKLAQLDIFKFVQLSTTALAIPSVESCRYKKSIK
jgi:hypothetical protein